MTRRPVATREQYEDCIRRGLSTRQAADELGCSVQTAWRQMRNYTPPRYPVEAQYRACAEAGLSVTETARKLGVHRVTVRNAGLRFGLTFVHKSAAGSAAKLRKHHAAGNLRWPRNMLTKAERADYDLLMRNDYRTAEALRAIKRADLLAEAAE